MSRSEIFDSFVKIAQEKGMISNDSSEAKKKLEQTHRADSLSISDIEALYGVKPDAPKNMEYEHNIMENAHPNSVIVSPSYDKINGLVENNNERQNIILNIVNKTPNGLLTQKKYAEKEFMSALVSVANDLDNKNIDELRVLADACLMQVYSKKSKPLKKQAQLIETALVAATIGALYLQQHMNFANEGFETNSAKLIAELDDMITSSSSWYGVGVDYKETLTTMVTDFKNKLTGLSELFQKIKPLIDSLEKPQTAEELIAVSKQPKTNEVINAFKSFYGATANMLTYVQTIQKNFASESFKARQTQSKGWAQSLIDKVQFLHGGHGLVADDFDDVNRAIPPYLTSIKEILDIFSSAKSKVDKAKADLSSAEAQKSKLLGNDMPDPSATPAAEPSKTEPGKGGLAEDLAKIPGYSSISGLFGK